MTCGTHRCCLCEPPRVLARDYRGRFLGGYTRRRAGLLDSPYYADGHLTNGKNLKGKPTNKPHREYCPGCLERMGVSVPAAVMEVQ